jgi:hypothetical protein
MVGSGKNNAGLEPRKAARSRGGLSFRGPSTSADSGLDVIEDQARTPCRSRSHVDQEGDKQSCPGGARRDRKMKVTRPHRAAAAWFCIVKACSRGTFHTPLGTKRLFVHWRPAGNTGGLYDQPNRDCARLHSVVDGLSLCTNHGVEVRHNDRQRSRAQGWLAGIKAIRSQRLQRAKREDRRHQRRDSRQIGQGCRRHHRRRWFSRNGRTPRVRAL